MAILQSCCCWQSVRKGSYASAIYTMSYYSLTCFIMGITVQSDSEYYFKKGNGTSTMKPKTTSFLEPSEVSTVTMVYYLIVLFSSTLGVVCSLLLMVGLYLEIRFLLLPWMAIISVSSFIDISHSAYWLTLDDPNFNPLTAVFFTVELFIFLLNAYSLLCVISQYQEYKAGRGTAAYYDLLQTMRRRDQTAPLSVRCSQQQTTGTSYLLTTASSHPPRDFCQLTNDCSATQNPSSAANDNIKLRRVQFMNEDDRMKTKLSRQNFDSQPLVSDNDGETIINEDEEDYMSNRNDYLWGSVAEESILICNVEVKHSQNDEREKRKRKKDAKEVISSKTDVEGNPYK
ncbi:uncharacterized protein LOC135835012 isoform X2 [Planococcus citri]|uniref:uncharacterized protein LOC135835012 isoform X2 n=1 Tax=Planococcus citri TaxID=170843 RepID=UPI0031F8212B